MPAAPDLHFAGGWALEQLWLFWVAPLIGGVLGGGIYRSSAVQRNSSR